MLDDITIYICCLSSLCCTDKGKGKQEMTQSKTLSMGSWVAGVVYLCVFIYSRQNLYNCQMIDKLLNETPRLTDTKFTLDFI